MNDIVVFDIETKETFDEVGGFNIQKLTPSLVGIYSYQNNQLLTFLESEFDRLWPYFEQAALLVGFNSDHFDIPILARFFPPLSEIQSLDLMAEVKRSAGHRVSLDSAVRATLGAQKTADGLMAIKMFREDRLDELRQYCAADVALTRDLYQFGKEHGHILIDSFSGQKKVPVNFDPPVLARQSATLSLGL